MPPEARIGPRTFAFLRELAAHNERAWFEANKQRYLDDVRDPLLLFVAACRHASPLARAGADGPELAAMSRAASPREASPRVRRAKQLMEFLARAVGVP